MKGVVLAAGAGTRLRPLTRTLPKALAPVGGRPLVEWALERIRPYVGGVAVNAHHHAARLIEALADADVHLSLEEPAALGTAGALGQLRPWIAGEPVLLTNADAWYPPGDARPVLDDFVRGWDGERIRLLGVRRAAGAGDFGPVRYVGTALLPWWSVRDLAPVPSGLYEVSWRDAHARGRVELVETDLLAVDCGTPEDLARADALATRLTTGQPPGE